MFGRLSFITILFIILLIILLNYTFKNQRIHRRNMLAPNHGYGFSVNHDMVTSAIWGDKDYNKTEIDLFTHQKAGPLSFYARGRYEKLSGSPLPQDQLGIFDMVSYHENEDLVYYLLCIFRFENISN